MGIKLDGILGRQAQRHTARWYFVFAGLALFQSGVAAAQQPDMQSAAFNRESHLSEIVIVPSDLRTATAASVRCQGFVETDGRLTDYVCDMDEEDRNRRLIEIVSDALATEIFSPARVGGRDVRVLMSFAILIACEANDCSIAPVPHHGYHLAEMGLDYVAPQPIISGERWYDGFEDRGFDPRNRSRRPRSFTVAVDVNPDGSASASCIYTLVNVDLDDAPQRNRQKLESIMSELANTKFIPGFYDGSPVSMRFFETNNFVSVAQAAGSSTVGAPTLRAFAGESIARDNFGRPTVDICPIRKCETLL